MFNRAQFLSANISNLINIALFGFIILSPTILFLTMGVPSLYERRAFAEFPVLSGILEHDPNARNQLTTALSERSFLRKWSIVASNGIDRFIFGFVDTDQVVSGLNGVWFYKRSFEIFSCENQDYITPSLRRLRLTGALLEGANSNILFSLSPNKATMRFEEVGGRAASYSDCYYETSRRLNISASSLLGHRYINHRDSVEINSMRFGNSYFDFDTHWENSAAMPVLTDLYTAFDGIRPIEFMDTSLQVRQSTGGDLAFMTLLPTTEQTYFPNPTDFEAQLQRVGPRDENVIFIHDSFYNRIHSWLASVFINSEFYPIATVGGLFNNRSSSDFREFQNKIENADWVIINLVERNFISSVANGFLSLNSPIGDLIIKQNSQQALSECGNDSEHSLLSSVEVRNATQALSNDYNTHADPQIIAHLQQDPIVNPSANVCISIDLKVTSTDRYQLFIPVDNERASEAASFRQYPEEGNVSIRLIIPYSELGQYIRLDPTGGIGSNFIIDRFDVFFAPSIDDQD